MHPGSLTVSLDRMRRQLHKVVFKTSHKREKVFAFIDAQNIAKGIENSGWKINWSVFRQWLVKNYDVSQAYMYIGFMAENRDLYLQLNNNGFNIDLKQTVKSMSRSNTRDRNDIKGNVDVDLTIGVWREYNNYDKAIIISGDGDFTSLIQHLIDKKKLKKIIVPEFYSSLFRKFNDYIIELNNYREELKYIKGRRNKPAFKLDKSIASTTTGKGNRGNKAVAVKQGNLKHKGRQKARQNLKHRVSLFNNAKRR